MTRAEISPRPRDRDQEIGPVVDTLPRISCADSPPAVYAVAPNALGSEREGDNLRADKIDNAGAIASLVDAREAAGTVT